MGNPFPKVTLIYFEDSVMSMIIAVSDIHLGYDRSNKKDFLDFINTELPRLRRNDHLVLLGDIFEYWRRQNVQATKENEEILKIFYETSKLTNVHYVVGNHDYTMIKLYEKFKDNFPFKVTKNLRLSDNGNNFYFTHGYELEVLASLEPLTVEDYERLSEWLCERTEEFFGGFLSTMYKMLKLNPLRQLSNKYVRTIRSVVNPAEHGRRRKGLNKAEQLAKARSARCIFLGMNEDEFLIFGHTHKPFKDESNRVANTGSWVEDPTRSDWYIQIENGRVELKKWASRPR